MYGREPNLPVDFILGQVPDPFPGTVQNWVAEHCSRLKVAFTGARKRMVENAGRRKERYDTRVKEAPLSVGQLVYLRDSGFRGRHKIRDIWQPDLFKVLKVPVGDGPIYTVAPGSNLQALRNVHRDMLKAQITSSPTAELPPITSVPLKSPEGDTSSDNDFWVSVPSTSLQTPVAIVDPGLSSGPVATQVENILAGDGAPGAGSVPLEPRPRILRRTTRATAGKHPNLHHLPRALSESS